jgi:subtilisin family serine protease
MKRTGPNLAGRRHLLFGMVFCAISALALGAEAPKAAAAPKPNPADGVSLQDMSSLFGPGSQLQAATDGEFNINIGDDNQLDNFRAVKDVILISKDNDLRCDEMTYDRAKGLMVATAVPNGLVHITMRSSNSSAAAGPGATGGSPNDTRATCGYYEYYVNEKRHVLKNNPIIYQKDRQGKEAAIVGKLIEMTQDAAGRWRMIVKGDPAIVDPKKTGDLARARTQMGGGGAKPVVNIDTTPGKEGASTKSATPSKALRIDEGNVEKLQQPKPVRVAKLEERG